ncbi:hypothetical protein NLM27_17265 [Bradyrhizobium sp. CCGB12]|uniref:hypothetical protein n=1 Tax=Bradyrhizobium sp. CCGB12 TaxID=2949632 RepID=UPI0020B41937|nr:hypothetical protein [Bradyrhizobium sp. CCGB12]MCP3390530.1 hypothetical protein [Bradyrhizobium sp. CCGB12]
MSQTYIADNGYFYRLKATFGVKESGEELSFDYVVACNLRVTRWRSGGSSDDSSISPKAMIMATRDGHAVMIRTLHLCSGPTTENGMVPPDVLPLAVWFDDVDDLSAGVGYLSEDAYDNPLSRLTFRGARIERATREDWERWRQSSAAEYVQKGKLPGPWGYNFPNQTPPELGQYISTCETYRRFKLPEELRVKLRELWPQDKRVTGLCRRTLIGPSFAGCSGHTSANVSQAAIFTVDNHFAADKSCRSHRTFPALGRLKCILSCGGVSRQPFPCGNPLSGTTATLFSISNIGREQLMASVPAKMHVTT